LGIKQAPKPSRLFHPSSHMARLLLLLLGLQLARHLEQEQDWA
jgi:hypothetical protein